MCVIGCMLCCVVVNVCIDVCMWFVWMYFVLCELYNSNGAAWRHQHLTLSPVEQRKRLDELDLIIQLVLPCLKLCERFRLIEPWQR